MEQNPPLARPPGPRGGAFILAILVLLGWRVAGRIGVGCWLPPALGTPWPPASAVAARRTEPQTLPGAPRPDPRRGPA